jgi:hypothetical protein
MRTDTPDVTSHLGVPGIRAQGTALRCTNFQRFQAAAIFYPNFYPKRRRSRIERLYHQVMAANRSSRPEYVTSLPSWHAGSIPVARSSLLTFFDLVFP